MEEREEPFDILCTRDNQELRVEVKCTRSLAATAELTIHGVRNAYEYPSELFIVRNIYLDWIAVREPLASGGDSRNFTARQSR